MERTVEEKEKDLRMMKNPFNWPQMVLPLKRRVEGENLPEVGILNGLSTTVYLINMYDEKWENVKFADMPKKKYDSFEAIQEDGWVVD